MAGVGRGRPAAAGQCPGGRAARGRRVLLRRARPAGVHPEGFDGEPSFIDLARASEEELDATIASYQEAFTWWRRNDVISVAAVQGHAIGAGFQLALACDLRVVADDVQFAMRETSLGLVPDLTGTKPLLDLVGYGRALEICATGRFVGAAESERIGLANLVVPAAELEAAVKDLAAPLLAAPRDAVIETKALLREASGAATTSSAPPSVPPRAAGCGISRAWGSSQASLHVGDEHSQRRHHVPHRPGDLQDRVTGRHGDLDVCVLAGPAHP